jgi:nucleotide-binding universal stress UspA family protein
MSVPQNILVPVVATEASLDAVMVAALMARGKKGRVYVTHVIEVNRSLPLNAELEAEARRGEQLIRRAEEMALHDAGYPVTGTLLQAREAGPAIVDEALDHEIDAIIVGVAPAAVGRPGHTVDYLLKYATCSVWVVRQSMAPRKPHHQE